MMENETKRERGKETINGSEETWILGNENCQGGKETSKGNVR